LFASLDRILPQAVKGAILDPLAQHVAASVPYPGRNLADTAAPLHRAIGKASKFSTPGRGLPGMFLNQPGGYASAANAANPMGPMRGRFADLRGIHSQTHGGYASDGDRRPVMVREVHRTYTDATVQRLRNALMGMIEDRA
jgi:hypothetical protein